MADTFGQRALVHIAGALGPFANAARPLVGPSWAFVPGFTVFFLQVFTFTTLWIRYVTRIDRKKVPFLASCAMSRWVQRPRLYPLPAPHTSPKSLHMLF